MIKTTLKLSICLFITLPITSQTYLYEMFSPTVSDARSVSMGRTSTASGMNSNSIFSNPSIIANFDDWRFQAGGRLIMQKNTLQEKDFDVYEPKRTPHYSISHLSFSMPYQLPPEFSSLTPKLSFGIGYKMYFDYGQNTDLVTQQGKRQKIRRVINSKGGLDVITPTVALKFDDRLSVGISFNTSLSGKITESHDSGRDVLKTEIETDYSFLRYGLLGKINDQLTLGFSFTPSFEWNWSELWGTFQGKRSGDSNSYRIEIPSITAIGGTYQYSPNSLIVAEYQSRKYGNIKINDKRLDVNSGACYRIGSEYIDQSSVIRLGLFADAIIKDEIFEIVNRINFDDYKEVETDGYVIGITAGVGYEFSLIYLDVFGEYSVLTDYDPVARSGDFETFGENIRFGLTVNYRFSKK